MTVRRHRRDTLLDPATAGRVTWEYAVRPNRQVMLEAAVELRRFDVRRWRGLRLPPTTWVVTGRDGVIDPDVQRASAELFGAAPVEIPAEHSVIARFPDAMARILDGASQRPGSPNLTVG